jgi:hypothetical protein
MREGEYINSLIGEYEPLLPQRPSKNANGEYDESDILIALSASADWSISGAREIVRLVENYRAFMLRNALAIAVVLGKEDGSAGF